jgi:hypothetical protein
MNRRARDNSWQEVELTRAVSLRHGEDGVKGLADTNDKTFVFYRAVICRECQS